MFYNVWKYDIRAQVVFSSLLSCDVTWTLVNYSRDEEEFLFNCRMHNHERKNSLHRLFINDYIVKNRLTGFSWACYFMTISNVTLRPKWFGLAPLESTSFVIRFNKLAGPADEITYNFNKTNPFFRSFYFLSFVYDTVLVSDQCNFHFKLWFVQTWSC